MDQTHPELESAKSDDVISAPEPEEKLNTSDEETILARVARPIDPQSHHVAISRQKQLPLELLYAIFDYTSLPHKSERAHIKFPDDLKSNQSPWNLRHVSSSWRRAALSRRTFWNALEVEWTESIPDPDTVEPRFRHGPWIQRLNNAKQMLPNYGTLDITVTIGAESGYPPPDNPAYAAYKILIEPLMKRIKSLTYRWPDSSLPCFSFLHRNAFQQMTSLSRLTLDFALIDKNRPSLGWAHGCRNHFIFGLENLTHLDLIGDNKSLEFFLEQDFPWGNLNTLKLLHGLRKYEDPCFVHVVPTLMMCDSLKYLYLDNNDPPANPHTIPVRLPRLETFRVVSIEMEWLTHFITPLLTSLQISCFRSCPKSLAKFLRQSQCSLQDYKESHTSYRNFVPSAMRGDFVQYMDLLTTVKTFTTITVLEPDEFQGIGNGQWLPNVERLQFPTRSPFEMLTLLEPRFSSAGNPIKAVTVEVREGDILAEDAARLEAMIEDVRARTGTNIELCILSMAQWYLRRRQNT